MGMSGKMRATHGMSRSESAPASVYTHPQVNLDFASRTWYSQSGARGLHKALGFEAQGRKFLPASQASRSRKLSEDGWNTRHQLVLQNVGLQTNTLSYFDRPMEAPKPRDRRGGFEKRAMVPTWKLDCREDGSVDRPPPFEPMKSVLSPLSRPAWQCRHMFATPKKHSPRAMLQAPPGMNPTDWNSQCHNGMRTYFDGCNLPAFQKPIL